MRPVSMDCIVQVTWENRRGLHGCSPVAPDALLRRARLATGPLVGPLSEPRQIDALERVIQRYEGAVKATRATTQKLAEHYPFGWPFMLTPVARV